MEHVRQSKDNSGFCFLPLLYLRQGPFLAFHLPGQETFELGLCVCWGGSPSPSSSLALTKLGLDTCYYILLYVGCREVNLGPHMCKGKVLPTEPSLQPKHVFLLRPLVSITCVQRKMHYHGVEAKMVNVSSFLSVGNCQDSEMYSKVRIIFTCQI